MLGLAVPVAGLVGLVAGLAVPVAGRLCFSVNVIILGENGQNGENGVPSVREVKEDGNTGFAGVSVFLSPVMAKPRSNAP